jgi:hypothetical protein
VFDKPWSIIFPESGDVIIHNVVVYGCDTFSELGICYNVETDKYYLANSLLLNPGEPLVTYTRLELLLVALAHENIPDTLTQLEQICSTLRIAQKAIKGES